MFYKSYLNTFDKSYSNMFCKIIMIKVGRWTDPLKILPKVLKKGLALFLPKIFHGSFLKNAICSTFASLHFPLCPLQGSLLYSCSQTDVVAVARPYFKSTCQ